MFTDGLSFAGDRYGNPMDVRTTLEALLEEQNPSAQEIADGLLLHAMKLDEGRPGDDISVVVLRTLPDSGDMIRRMTVLLPVENF